MSVGIKNNGLANCKLNITSDKSIVLILNTALISTHKTVNYLNKFELEISR